MTMANILFFDTSFESCKIIISKNGKVCFYLDDSRNLRHSQKLLADIDYALKSNNLSLDDIDYIAAPLGPGTFTGIRICLATAKSFCFALNKKLILLNNLETFIFAFENYYLDNSQIFAFINAGNNMFYFSNFYYIPTQFQAITENSLIEKSEISNLLNNSSNLKYIIADYSLIDFLKNDNFNNCRFINSIDISADMINKLLISKIQKNDFANVINALPIYIKKSDAETLKDRKNNGC